MAAIEPTVVVVLALLLVGGLVVAGGTMLCCQRWWKRAGKRCEGEVRGAELDERHQPWYLQQPRRNQPKREQLFEAVTLPHAAQAPSHFDHHQPREVHYIEQHEHGQQYTQDHFAQQYSEEGEGERGRGDVSFEFPPGEEEEEEEEGEEEGEEEEVVKRRERSEEMAGNAAVNVNSLLKYYK